ncbi:serine/threonine-protein kinase [Nocardia sp. NPDC005978]|uniref:serine/threonine-protein kinase n=1 Tax=Nocardia sp. NPDC005978 TaxID=3156725 RepID=UPI0033A77347
MTAELLPGMVFAGYTVESRLGESGSVYLAGHPRLPRRDALKVLAASDAAARARLLREAEAVARLDHPNIVAVHDRGIDQGRAWVAMRFVDGVDAAALIRRGPAALPTARVVDIVDQVARGVDAAAAAGVLHGDIKPANILIESPAGQRDRVFVTDFGIAGNPGPAATPAMVAYAAPEQLAGVAIDARTAVYGLGCTLFELLTGTKPFPGTTVDDVVRGHLYAPAPRATDRVPALPPEIDAVLGRALAKNPGERFSSCGALAAATRAALLGSPPNPAAPRPNRRLPIALAGLAIAAAVIAAAIAVVRHEPSGEPAGAPPIASTTAAASMTTSAKNTATTSWGSYQHTVAYFTGLLPQTQDVQGYKGIRCSAVNRELQPVSVAEQLPDRFWVSCTGDAAPVERLTMNCTSVDQRYLVQPLNGMRVEGDQKWQRPSGTGRIIWGTRNDRGLLLIDFDRGNRTSCGIEVVGLTSGSDLYDRWWPGAPL